MRMDSGVELKFEKIKISGHLFDNMEQIEENMQKRCGKDLQKKLKVLHML